MLNEQYIRTAASKYGWKKYYSIMRPVGIGTVPTNPTNGMMDFINYDNRTEIQTTHGIIRAWAEIYYDRELTDHELRDYEMVRG